MILTENQLAVLNQKEGLNVSDRYKVINTGQVLNELLSQGFEVETFQAINVRKTKKQGFQAHSIGLSHPELNKVTIEGSVPRLTLHNSYDKSMAFGLNLGIFRFICSNGLMTGSNLMSFNFKHIGDINNQLGQFLNQLMPKVNVLSTQVELLSRVNLDASQQVKLAQEVLSKTLFKDRPNIIKDNMIYNRFLQSRRVEDNNNDAYTVLNRLQENIIKGGIQVASMPKEHDKDIKTAVTRPINAINKNKTYNEIIYDTSFDYVDKILKVA